MEDTPKQSSLETSTEKSRRRRRRQWRGLDSPGRLSARSSSVPGSGAITPVTRTYGEEPRGASPVHRKRISSQDSSSLGPSSRRDSKRALHSQGGPRSDRRSPSGHDPPPATAEHRHRDPADLQQPYSSAGGSTDGGLRAYQQPPELGAAAGGGGADVASGRHELPHPESQAVLRSVLGRSSFKRSMSPVGSIDRRVTINPAAMRGSQEAKTTVFVSPPPGIAAGPGSSLAGASLPAQASRGHSARGELVIQEPPPVWPARSMSFDAIDANRRKSLLVQEAISHLPIPSGTVHKKPMLSPLTAHRSRRPVDHSYGTRGVSCSPRHGTEDYSQKLRRLKTVAVRLLSHRYSRKATVCMVVGFALFLVIIYFVLRALSSPASRDSLCSSDDCLDHARQLLQSLDTSVDPCAHFHAYVCGHKAVLHREAVDDLQYAMLVVSSASRAVTPSPPLNGAFPAASKAMAALSTCLEVSSAQSAEPFVSFMKARGMLWPAERLKANLKLVDVLDVLLDLTINWRVVLWFDVKRTYLTEDYGLVVVFGEPGPLPVLRMRQVSTLDGVAYANVVKGVSHFLTNGKIQLSDPSIQTLRADENAVRSALLSAPVDEHDVLLPLHRVHQLFNEKLSLNELLGVIGKHLKSISGVSLETKILIVRRHSLTQLLSLFEVISPTRLFSVISWMFSYAYVWMLNTGFGSLAAVEAENTSDLVQCFLAVHESFGIVQASPLFHALFDADSLKDEVFAVFNSTSKALTNMLQASEMISNLTKKEAALKIGAHIRVRLLPPEAFMADDVLDMLYVNFPGGGNRTFFDTWLKSKEVLKATLPDPFHDRLLTARYRRMSGSASYFYSLNLVWLGLSALLPPLYRSRGSALMTYSGLGYQFARQLVRAADERGRKMDYSGLDISWWEQHGSCALDAAQTAEEKATVTDLFALDVALEALKTSGHDLSSLRIKQMEEFSPTQMFYISYCSHFCDSPAGPDECDLAINASDFANAFGCQREAARTCLFA